MGKKQLKDWTLEEVKNECEKNWTLCEGCKFCTSDLNCLVFSDKPIFWDFDKIISLTDDEKAVCRLLKEEGFTNVKKENDVLYCYAVGYHNYIPKYFFPSLKNGDKINLTTTDFN